MQSNGDPPAPVHADNSCGYRVTLRCIEDCCPVTVSIRQFREGGNKCWRVYDRYGIKEEWTHSFFCNKVASIPVGVAADLLKDETARGKDKREFALEELSSVVLEFLMFNMWQPPE